MYDDINILCMIYIIYTVFEIHLIMFVWCWKLIKWNKIKQKDKNKQTNK